MVKSFMSVGLLLSGEERGQLDWPSVVEFCRGLPSSSEGKQVGRAPERDLFGGLLPSDEELGEIEGPIVLDSLIDLPSSSHKRKS